MYDCYVSVFVCVCASFAYWSLVVYLKCNKFLAVIEVVVVVVVVEDRLGFGVGGCDGYWPW